mgnify:CR=1 FL=1
MPVKNAGLYLEECLDSIINQDYKDWQLIAINDGASDNSQDILLKYAEKHANIFLYPNQGQGIIPALNLAFEKSDGNFITRMDADDKMTHDKLNLHYNNLKNNGKGYISVGLVQYFSTTELGEGYKKYATWLNNLTLKENNFSEIYKECVIPSPNWMLHRKDLINCGAFKNNIYPEDYDLCFRMRNSGLKIKSVNAITHYWRDHNLRSSRTSDNYKDNRFLDLKLYHFLKTDFNTEKNLVLWGAGKKGKAIAKKLLNKNIDFTWISNNSKKHGVNIYNQIIQADKYLKKIQQAQCIIPIAAKYTNEEIKNQLLNLDIRDYYFFC